MAVYYKMILQVKNGQDRVAHVVTVLLCTFVSVLVATNQQQRTV